MNKYVFHSSLHGDGFERVVVGGARLHLLFKPEAVVGLVAKIEVGLVVLCGIHDDYTLLGERNVDVKHSDCETHDECWPGNVIQNRHASVKCGMDKMIIYYNF
jgi:glutamine amidotransferase-like uncharacterized protein